MVESLIASLDLAMLTLIVSIKLVLFTVHNYLTKRDYTYSIDDVFDLFLAVLISIWVQQYYAYSSLPKPGTYDFVVNSDDLYAFYAFDANQTGKFRLMIFLACIVGCIWGRFLMML